MVTLLYMIIWGVVKQKLKINMNSVLEINVNFGIALTHLLSMDSSHLLFRIKLSGIIDTRWRRHMIKICN